MRPTNNNASAGAAQTQGSATAQGDAPAAAGGNSQSGPAAGGINDGAFNMPAFNNPNVELFMEVTPESITIDSLETTLLGSNPTGDSEFLVSHFDCHFAVVVVVESWIEYRAL